MPNNSYKSKLPDLAPLINQSILEPHITLEVLKESCDAAKHYGFAGLCTNLIRLPAARKNLGKEGQTKLIAAIAFPFGSIPISLKQAEAEWALANGAEELDVVPNFLSLSENLIEPFGEELAKICSLSLPVTVIMDMAHLLKEKLPLAVEVAIDAGVTRLQSGNGFGPPATTSEIRLLSELSRGRCSVAAAGGIKDLDHVIDLVEAGATRIGTSRGLEIMKAQRLRSKE